MEPRNEGNGKSRTAVAAIVLVVEAGLAVLGILVHYSFTAEYGDVTDLAEGWRSRLSSGVGVMPLGLGVLAAAVVVSVSAQRPGLARRAGPCVRTPNAAVAAVATRGGLALPHRPPGAVPSK